MNGTDVVTGFYMAQGKHDRQLGRLTKKIVAKWDDEDFAALVATRAARDSAVAALSSAQIAKHCPEFKRTKRADFAPSDAHLSAPDLQVSEAA
jgi:hypothetical protein